MNPVFDKLTERMNPIHAKFRVNKSGEHDMEQQYTRTVDVLFANGEDFDLRLCCENCRRKWRYEVWGHPTRLC
ncbi:hypothetical protein Csa_012260 [Cucumis sativus]|uniref:Uncharacterized protein n=1 Tax=Cucumis sativus TaxID=3659 RepID=A0A0A0L274_CUCSA|nr:hypothetical protein Csa_012260 [Cucumis sativus]